MAVKANTGRILLGDYELAYCEGIEVDYDFGEIDYWAGDYADPIYVGHGNRKITINVDCAEFKADDEDILDETLREGTPVTVQGLAGDRGGGITFTLTSCVVVHYTVTSRQGDVVKARVVLVKQHSS